MNRTGLTGDFDFDLEWSPETSTAAAPANATAPQTSIDHNLSIFTALREQLGLELKSTTGPIDVIVVDSVERPTPD